MDGMGRWLGIKGDEEELRYRQEQYRQQRARRSVHHQNKTALSAAQVAVRANGKHGAKSSDVTRNWRLTVVVANESELERKAWHRVERMRRDPVLTRAPSPF